MQPLFRSDNVSESEWRWVTVWGGLFAFLTLIPFAWAIIASQDNFHFFGLLADIPNGASALSKIRDGINGNWAVQLRYTPEQHEATGFFPFYVLLGHVARIFGFSEILVFHLARLATSYLMFASFYQLSANIWKRIRPRRLFFFLTILGSGLGWLLLAAGFRSITPDLSIPEAFPLYAAFTNPQYPLSIALLALLAGQFMIVFRPGFREVPAVDNGGLSILVFSTLLVIVQTTALIAFGSALFVFTVVTSYRKRQIAWHELRWFSMVFLPAFPVVVYYVLILATNDILREYNLQLVSSVPNPFLMILGYGLLLVIAAPGIYYGLRRFNRDGDQLMIIWLIVNVIFIYLPFNLQQRLLLGLTIPIGYFAVRAIEEFWFDQIPIRYYPAAMVIIFTLIIPSNIIAMVIPIYGAIIDEAQGEDSALLVHEDYSEIYDWLDENGNPGEVILASPNISLWVPAETDLRVVYGHPFESVPADALDEMVEDYYSGDTCDLPFDESQDFEVDYVVWGPQEVELSKDEGSTRCRLDTASAANLEYEFGDVTLYVLREPR
jgi:hypothetical protein